MRHHYQTIKLHIFLDSILQLLNRRELERLKEKWWNKNPEKKDCEKADDQSDGISIQNIGGVFIVIFVGIGLACITLAFEYWWYKYRKGSKVIDVQEASHHHHHHNQSKLTFPKDMGLTKAKEGTGVKNVASLYPRPKF